jgi:hypothetical protein
LPVEHKNMFDIHGKLTHLPPPGCAGPDYTDLSRGAFHQGLVPETVFIASIVLDEYAEIDPCLGRNLAGAVLDSLRVRLAESPRLQAESLTLSVARRDDGEIVDLELRVERFRLRGHECLVLEKAGEGEVASPARPGAGQIPRPVA